MGRAGTHYRPGTSMAHDRIKIGQRWPRIFEVTKKSIKKARHMNDFILIGSRQAMGFKEKREWKK